MNQKLNKHDPCPFDNDDWIYCNTDHYLSIKLGEKRKVLSMHRHYSTNEWVVIVLDYYNNAQRTTSYFAKNFTLLKTETKENKTMANELTDHYFAPFDGEEIDFSKTEKRPSYTSCRNDVTKLIKENPSNSYAMWTIASIAEVATPAVTFRKMQ